MPRYIRSAAQLREIRKALGLTQKQAAARVGVHQRTWNGWETGRSRIPPQTRDAKRLLPLLGATEREVASWLRMEEEE